MLWHLSATGYCGSHVICKQQFTYHYTPSVYTPVANAPGKVQTGLLQVGLEAGLPGDAATLRTDMGRSVFMDPLVGGHGTRVWQHHGR